MYMSGILKESHLSKTSPYTLMTVIEGAGDLVVDGKHIH